MSRTPIGDHALLSDCHSAAVVDKTGSVVWWCVPRFDSPSVFAGILHDDAGHLTIRAKEIRKVARSYRTESLVLETRLVPDGGEVTLTDVATLASTAIVSGAGKGAVRHCVDVSGRGRYETCTTWEPGREIGFEVDVSTYPLTYRALFRAFRGTWSVEPVDGGAVVTVRFDAEVRRIPGASTLAAKLSERAESELESILQSYRVAVDSVESSSEV